MTAKTAKTKVKDGSADKYTATDKIKTMLPDSIHKHSTLEPGCWYHASNLLLLLLLLISCWCPGEPSRAWQATLPELGDQYRQQDQPLYQVSACITVNQAVLLDNQA